MAQQTVDGGLAAGLRGGAGLRRMGPEIRRVLAPLRIKRRDLPLYLPLSAFSLIVLACFFAPWLFHLPPPSFSSLSNADLPLGAAGHLLGTDYLGNDLLSRVLRGGQISIEVGLGATAIGFFIGTSIGTVAGYAGGVVDATLMRILDVVLAFPALILTMCISAFLGPSERNEIIAISFFTIPHYSRLARAGTLKLRGRSFVLADKVMGARPRWIAARHVYPNVFPQLLTIAPITISIAMIVEATLSFLGLGIRPPAPSWGNMLAQGQSYITTQPKNIVIPAVALSLTVWCLNFMGEQLRARISH